MKRFISTILATLLLVTAVPLTSLAADWSGSTYHEDQDESPKISYQKAYSYLSGHEGADSSKDQYTIRCVNSPKPGTKGSDNYPEDGGDTYWKATSDAPYFAVSYKMTVKSTAVSSNNSSWQEGGSNGGLAMGGSDQGWYWGGSSCIDKNPRMGISLGYTWHDSKGDSVGWGYTYGFFGFAYSKITETTSQNGYTKYSDPVLMFGPTGYEADKIDDNDPEADTAYQSPFYKNRITYPLNAVPVYDKDGKTEITLDFTNTENVIMLVGSYINNVVTLKAYINGYQIRKIWGSTDAESKDTFSFTDYPDYTYSGWGSTFHSAFRGQFGFINQLNETFAYARFTRASHPLDQNAFNVHHAKVDASRPDDSNNNWYNDQANQWKVDMKHFAAEYTIEIENKTYSYINSDKDLKATSLNCGLVLGRQSRDPDKLLGTIDFRFTDDSNGKCSWGSDSKLWFGPDNHGNATNRSGTLGLEWRRREFYIGDWSGTNDGTTLENSFSTHTVLITGDYNASAKTATIRVWLDGKLINSWFGDETVTITNFGDGLNYIGWRTNVKGVNAVARFTQWDEDANLDYAAAHGTVFDEKTAGPMTGYWDRTVEKNALSWGDDPNDTYDAVSYIADNEAWEGYEHPNKNAYQLGMITDTSRSFIVQADIPYYCSKGFYITAEKPTDDTIDGLKIGISDGGMDDIRKWYNEYYYIELRSDGCITTWVNVGDGDPFDSRWIWPDTTKSTNDDRLDSDGVTGGHGDSDYLGVRIEYKNKELSVWVKDGGYENEDSEYKLLYTIDNLDYPNMSNVNEGCNVDANTSLFKDCTGPIYFGLMVGQPEDGKTADFQNVKVSYGLQSPQEVQENVALDNNITTKEDKYEAGVTFDKNGKSTGRNGNIAGFAQTREGTNPNTYDLRVAVEGDDIG